mmetsp:Transcript_1049/g.2274  ORF Transcript_1049/g.2274 Transcript_1049/m.2274 type:complete len:216 (-) Transcript_1049:1716-2363(-)
MRHACSLEKAGMGEACGCGDSSWGICRCVTASWQDVVRMPRTVCPHPLLLSSLSLVSVRQVCRAGYSSCPDYGTALKAQASGAKQAVAQHSCRTLQSQVQGDPPAAKVYPGCSSCHACGAWMPLPAVVVAAAEGDPHAAAAAAHPPAWPQKPMTQALSPSSLSALHSSHGWYASRGQARPLCAGARPSAHCPALETTRPAARPAPAAWACSAPTC